jgi:hypothetical protein
MTKTYKVKENASNSRYYVEDYTMNPKPAMQPAHKMK